MSRAKHYYWGQETVLTLEEANEWLEANALTPEEANEWMEANALTPEEANEWMVENVLTPEEANEWMEANALPQGEPTRLSPTVTVAPWWRKMLYTLMVLSLFITIYFIAQYLYAYHCYETNVFPYWGWYSMYAPHCTWYLESLLTTQKWMKWCVSFLASLAQ